MRRGRIKLNEREYKHRIMIMIIITSKRVNDRDN